MGDIADAIINGDMTEDGEWIGPVPSEKPKLCPVCKGSTFGPFGDDCGQCGGLGIVCDAGRK